MRPSMEVEMPLHSLALKNLLSKNSFTRTRRPHNGNCEKPGFSGQQLITDTFHMAFETHNIIFFNNSVGQMICRPHTRAPAFSRASISSAQIFKISNLNSIYFDSLDYFNGDLILLANFSNPNKKLDVRFEYLDVGLYFSDRFIATQTLQPFTLRQGEKRLESVRLISSLVYMPPNLGIQLQKEVQSNKVSYYVRGTFKVRATLGLVHFSYWLHGRCRLEMTSPPNGVLLGRTCKAKR
ncbi:hypothetical protein NL676_025500 [Syzygium grande]|nr:hypothetical protein NL676_025500 [Syzygium grande]